MEVERHNGFIVKVGNEDVMDCNMSDWILLYIKRLPGEAWMEQRDLLNKAVGIRMVKITKDRLYFEQK